MKKIYIVGSVGSGKTTLAKRLSEACGIKCYELDCIVREKTETGRYKRTPCEQIEIIRDIDSKDGCWIFEGVNRDSYRCLFDMADTIIFLDTPVWVRRCRIVKRFIKQRLRIEACEYESDFALLRLMLKWSYEFEQEKDEFEAFLSNYKEKLIRHESSRKTVGLDRLYNE